MDSELLQAIITARRAGEKAVLVTVARTWGSTPREAGTAMLVYPDGRLQGTIGGGCAEAEVRLQALNVLAEGMPRLYRVDMTASPEEEGMVCGGQMDVFLEPVATL